jgi:hypothetical protein
VEEKMDHDGLRSRLYEFYDGEVSPEEARAFSLHLASCSECRSEIEAWEAASKAFFKEAPARAPDGFSGRIMARIEKNAGVRPTGAGRILDFLSLPRWEVLTAVSASLLILSYFSFHFLKFQEGNGTTLMTLVEEQAGSEQQWLLTAKIDRDDVLGLALGENLDPSGSEVEFDE